MSDVSQEPLVSIGAINFNCERFVIATLDSISSQTYGNFELIIVDDCSTDGSLKLIQNWLLSYHRPYRLICHESNLGVCRAFNSFLKESRGEFLSIIATDDTMFPEKTAVQVRRLVSEGVGTCAVYSDAFLMQEDGTSRYGWFIQRNRDFAQVPSGDIFETLLEGNFIPAMSVLLRRSAVLAVGGWDEALLYEDYDMWLQLAKKFKFAFDGFPSVKYRVRRGSLANQGVNQSDLEIYSKHLNDSAKAIIKIEAIMVEAYKSSDKITLGKLTLAIAKTSFLKIILILWKLRVPRYLALGCIWRMRNSRPK